MSKIHTPNPEKPNTMTRHATLVMNLVIAYSLERVGSYLEPKLSDSLEVLGQDIPDMLVSDIQSLGDLASAHAIGVHGSDLGGLGGESIILGSGGLSSGGD
jgi:hypothetical protein